MFTARFAALSKPSVSNNFLHGGDAEPPLRPTPGFKSSPPLDTKSRRPKPANFLISAQERI
jgi:hypothetical protein